MREEREEKQIGVIVPEELRESMAGRIEVRLGELREKDLIPLDGQFLKELWQRTLDRAMFFLEDGVSEYFNVSRHPHEDGGYFKVEETGKFRKFIETVTDENEPIPPQVKPFVDGRFNFWPSGVRITVFPSHDLSLELLKGHYVYIGEIGSKPIAQCRGDYFAREIGITGGEAPVNPFKLLAINDTCPASLLVARVEQLSGPTQIYFLVEDERDNNKVYKRKAGIYFLGPDGNWHLYGLAATVTDYYPPPGRANARGDHGNDYYNTAAIVSAHQERSPLNPPLNEGSLAFARFEQIGGRADCTVEGDQLVIKQWAPWGGGRKEKVKIVHSLPLVIKADDVLKYFTALKPINSI